MSDRDYMTWNCPPSPDGSSGKQGSTESQAAMTHEIEPYEFHGFVILNHVGGVWGPTVYDSPEAAYAYIDRWQKDNPKVDLSKHRVVPGHSLTYAYQPQSSDDTFPMSASEGGHSHV